MKKVMLLFCLILSLSYGDEEQTACLQSKTQNSWSKKYKINGLVYSGIELYGILPFQKIDVLKYYFIVFWSNNETSIIKINIPYFGGEILYNLRGVDQNGIEWRLSNPHFCY